MSIIYEALQKTQKNRASVVAASPIEKEIPSVIEKELFADKKGSVELIDICLIVIIFCLVVAVIGSAFHKWKKYNLHKHDAQVAMLHVLKPVSLVDTRQVFKQSHMLNGVFLSASEKVALINNKSFHLGDTVDGMKLVSLELNKIKLQGASGPLVLNVFAG